MFGWTAGVEQFNSLADAAPVPKIALAENRAPGRRTMRATLVLDRRPDCPLGVLGMIQHALYLRLH